MKETSKEAYNSIEKDSSSIRTEVFRYIQRSGERGVTCDEIEEACYLRHQTASPRVYELHRSGRILDSGTKRHTRSGRRAIVWVAA